MTGYECYGKAVNLLGYTDTVGDLPNEQALQMRAGDAVEMMCRDLGVTLQSDWTAELPLSEKKAAALPYGVAMFLAQALGDTESRNHFRTLYNQKRARAMADSIAVKDVLPRDDGGTER